jgi:general secretion pathway protein I
VRGEKGFSLLEVLVALCIIAIAFGAVYRAQVQGISMTQESRDVTNAALLAQQKMAHLLSSLPSYGLRRGDFGDDYPGFWWEERVTGYNEFGSALRRVQIAVFWGPGDAARTLALEGYVLEPAEEEEAGGKEEEAAQEKKKSKAEAAPAGGQEADEEDDED